LPIERSISPELEGIKFLAEIKSSNSRTSIIFGFIQTLLGKIQQSENGLRVPVKIADGTSTVNALISHNALEQMFEKSFSTQEMKSSQGKILLKKHGKIGQKNIYDYYGKMRISKLFSAIKDCEFSIDEFLDC
jgi:hypothetical protein